METTFPLAKLSEQQRYERRQEDLYSTKDRTPTKALIYLRNYWYDDLVQMGFRRDYIAYDSIF